MKKAARLGVFISVAGVLAALVYWQLERQSVVVATALFREAATGWGLNPDQFVAVAPRTLSHQPATRVWEHQEASDVEQIHVTAAEDLVCRMRRTQGSASWEHLGCRQVPR